MDNILIISDFPDIQYKKDSGTPAFRLVVEAFAKEYNVHIIAPSGNDESYGNITYYRIPVKDVSGKSRLLNNINKKLFWFKFCNKSSEIALKLNKMYDFKLIYGAGCNSVYVAGELGERFSIPSVGRLFGTYLLPYLYDPIGLLLRFDEVMAFKSKCDKFIITNDGTGGDQVAYKFGIPRDKVYFLRNGVDIPQKCPFQYDDKNIRIISLARLSNWKHVERIIKSFAIAYKKNDRLVLDIVGDGPEKEFLVQLTKYYDISSKVIFHGEVTRERALRMIGCSDIFMSTNDYSNISNSLMESMFAGKAVIVLDTGDTSDVINGRNGLLVKDENGLSDAILMLCNDKIRFDMGIQAKNYAFNNFGSWDTRIKQEMTICRRLI